MKQIRLIALTGALLLSACGAGPVPGPAATPTATATDTPIPATAASAPAGSAVPDFAHIIVIVFENREFDSVIGNKALPNFNQTAAANTLLTQYYAITHPSLPNYLALFGGDTFKITSDCTTCFIQATSLPDQVEASGRTWRAYLENMPTPCYVGDAAPYAQKHDPFIYFDDIRLNATRCADSVVPLTSLSDDLAAGTLPNLVYIMPNLCNSAHDAAIDPFCGLSVADHWLGGMLAELLGYLEPRAASEPYLIILTWDEGQSNASCCGLPANAGGRVATILISPLARQGFQDATPYTHYSLLKTIEAAWNLPYLGNAAKDSNGLILAPWK